MVMVTREKYPASSSGSRMTHKYRAIFLSLRIMDPSIRTLLLDFIDANKKTRLSRETSSLHIRTSRQQYPRLSIFLKCHTVNLIKSRCCWVSCSIVRLECFREANKSCPTYVVLTEWESRKLGWESAVCMRSGIPSSGKICVAEERRVNVPHGDAGKVSRKLLAFH